MIGALVVLALFYLMAAGVFFGGMLAASGMLPAGVLVAVFCLVIQGIIAHAASDK